MVDSLDEEFIAEDEDDQGPAALKRLREKLAKAVAEKQEYLEGWQRARADFANFKREEASIQKDRESRLKAEFCEALIPALDSFEMAFGTDSFKAADANWRKGIEALFGGLLKSLEQVGVVQFVPTGERFDPYKHEALREVETEDPSLDHTIERVERAGYSIGEKIIRPAQVSVYTTK